MNRSNGNDHTFIACGEIFKEVVVYQNIDFRIQTLAQHVIIQFGFPQGVILSWWRRICVKVEQPRVREIYIIHQDVKISWD
ncbi:MAG: hypothetical protein NPIRA06_28530 [Nitrospirales bacterium]|nr:MAG: hypothetical protein NPIRA06_28530 [Nitrospirales bacterium]